MLFRTEELPQQSPTPKRKFSTASRVRYIGSKMRVADSILAVIGAPHLGKGRFIDLFCGTGAVGAEAATRGWKVHFNDHLQSSVITAAAQLTDKSNAKFEKLGGYYSAIDQLNAARPKNGAIYKEYSPSGESVSGHSRMYFTVENARKIDGIRSEIEHLYANQKISRFEQWLLLSDLISASNSVANIAGTYGCFLSKWSDNAISSLALRPRILPVHSHSVTTSIDDAFDFEDREEDVLYCDPPYTKRQYAAYYHLLETIVAGDHPVVEGVAGIRSWHAKSSPFCFKRKALNAFTKLIESKRSKNVFLSYSSQGHLAIDELVAMLKSHGDVRIMELQKIARYTPNAVSRANGTEVTEFILHLER